MKVNVWTEKGKKVYENVFKTKVCQGKLSIFSESKKTIEYDMDNVRQFNTYD